MPKHLTRISPVETLPDPADHEEGYPVLFEGALHVVESGAWVRPSGPRMVAATGATTVDAAPSTVVLADATSAAFTVTLPAAVAGREVAVKKVDASANAVTIATPGAETIDGDADTALAAQWDVAHLVSDGSNWFSI